MIGSFISINSSMPWNPFDPRKPTLLELALYSLYYSDISVDNPIYAGGLGNSTRLISQVRSMA
jgi:hypothetical protein